MKAMTTYLAEHLPVTEELLEEFRLSIKDRAVDLQNSLSLYDLDEDTVREKLSMLGLETGVLETSWTPSAMFYKLYRRLVRNRSTTGSVQTLARTGGQLEGVYRTIEEAEYYRSLNVYRDYEAPHLFGSDGYFYMVQDPKHPISSNALITSMLPAGYCFLCVSQFIGDDDGVLEYDFIEPNVSLYDDPQTASLDNDRVYISDFICDGDDFSLCSGELVEEDALFERIHASSARGIMPQHDMGWSYAGITVRDKSLGDLFRERDVRVQPKNVSWTLLLNHDGEGMTDASAHVHHAFTESDNCRDMGITDSLQYHKEIIISERQEYDVIHESVPDGSGGIGHYYIDITIPTVPDDVADMGVFGYAANGICDITFSGTMRMYDETEAAPEPDADYIASVTEIVIRI